MKRYVYTLLFALGLCLQVSTASALERVHIGPEGQRVIQCSGTSAAWYVPTGATFGMQAVWAIVHSAYAYEASLLDWSTPVDDIDYMVPYASSQWVTLPGGRQDYYTYLGAVYIPGSGWVAKFLTPWGGHFAFLHLRSIPASSVRSVQIGSPTATVPRPYSCADETSATISSLTVAPTSRVMTGGSLVGFSGWPEWPQYGNGTSGPGDAHLCLLLDASSVAWFYDLAAGLVHHQPPPFVFPSGGWNSWTRLWGKPSISPWASGCRLQGCLTWPASIWLSHQWLGGVVDHGVYDARNRVMKYSFDFGVAYAWPQNGAVKVLWHFPSRDWNLWRVWKHRSLISPYSHGVFTWAASQWLRNRWLGGVRDAGTWEPRNGMMRYRFQFGTLWCWPRYGTCRATR